MLKSLSLSLLLGLVVMSRTSLAQAPRELHYTFDFSDPQRVHATLELRMARGGAEPLILPSRWAGQTDLQRAVSNLRIVSGKATLTPGQNPSHWLLESRSASTVRIGYDLRQDWTGPLRHPFEHRVLLGPKLFQFNGENGLIAPFHLGTDAVDATFDFTGLPSSYMLVTSFGTEPHQHTKGAWSTVSNALFTGGEFRTVQIDVEGEPVLLAVHGDTAFQPSEIAPRVRDILGTERHFWRDTHVPWYAVVMTPYETPGSGGGGSGFTNAFNLFLSSKDDFGDDAASLFAHEAFHFWNPEGLGIVEDTQQIAWFGEGFTRFYQDVLLERAGLITAPTYLARLNATIRDYFLSPRIHDTNAELQTTTANDHFGYEEPYLRGAMIALWLDTEIYRQSEGRQTLSGLMLALRAESSRPLTAERIFGAAAHLVDAPTVDRLHAFALDGVAVPVSSASLGECIAFRARPAWTFDLGFDPASLHTRGTIQGVQQGSNAYEAGVRDGQLLGGWSLWNGDPERQVTLTVQDTDGRPARLSFLPRGQLTMVPQAQRLPDCVAAERLPG